MHPGSLPSRHPEMDAPSADRCRSHIFPDHHRSRFRLTMTRSHRPQDRQSLSSPSGLPLLFSTSSLIPPCCFYTLKISHFTARKSSTKGSIQRQKKEVNLFLQNRLTSCEIFIPSYFYSF